MYGDWHSRLLPYYSFDQFVHKVEQVAATKRVKVKQSYILPFGLQDELCMSAVFFFFFIFVFF